MNEKGETSTPSEPGEAAQVPVRVADDNAKLVDPCDPKDELMPLSGESATASESDPSNCHSTVVLDLRLKLALPSAYQAPTRKSMS